ncbi:MAG: pilin [Patescibacteria group bacterium]|nr:MAG: pilin [Patescibacteria group bacterium]
MIKKNQIFFFLLLLFSLFFYANSFVLPVHAETEPLLTSDIIAAAECKDGCSISVFMKVVIQAAKIILGLVGSLTLLMFVYGGFMLLVSAGNTERIQKGKDILLGSIVGLLIVFGSYIFINFVINDLLGAQGDFKFTGSSSIETSTQSAVVGVRQCPNRDETCIQPNEKCFYMDGHIEILGTRTGYCGVGHCCKLPELTSLTCRQRSGSCGVVTCTNNQENLGKLDCPNNSVGMAGVCCRNKPETGNQGNE